MRKTARNLQKGSSSFIGKLHKILETEDYKSIIRWTASQDAFVVKDTYRMQEYILPLYFRHKKINSFIRQLNFYDFHKLRGTKNSELIFKHDTFVRANASNFKGLKRKTSYQNIPVVKGDSVADPQNSSNKQNMNSQQPNRMQEPLAERSQIISEDILGNALEFSIPYMSMLDEDQDMEFPGQNSPYEPGSFTNLDLEEEKRDHMNFRTAEEGSLLDLVDDIIGSNT